MWLACYTDEEIAEKVGIGLMTVNERMKVLTEKYFDTKAYKLLSDYSDSEWVTPVYNIWIMLSKKQARIVEENIFLYREK
jgi:hypothetical protein